MPALKDITGQRYGRLTVIERHPEIAPGGKVQWSCRCDCGSTTVTTGNRLSIGMVSSCGCLRIEASRQTGLSNSSHGMTGSPEYKAWQAMRDRCLKPSVESYPHYGGRGIRTCQSWEESFENFYRDMGPKPSPQHSIDRRDNDGDYTPENCRWADPETQANNRSVNRYYELDGEKLTLAQISRKYGVNYNTLKSRVDRGGMSICDAISHQSYSRYNVQTTTSEQKGLGG